ncbi:hypothetical protein [Clostridium sp. JNZ J1-5]|nr:hypothetical protein [Clostridium sp.]
MLKRIIVKYKDGEILLHEKSSNEEDEMEMISTMIKNSDDFDEEDSGIHSIEIMFA